MCIRDRHTDQLLGNALLALLQALAHAQDDLQTGVQGSQKQRENSVRIKLNVVSSTVKGCLLYTSRCV